MTDTDPPGRAQPTSPFTGFPFDPGAVGPPGTDPDDPDRPRIDAPPVGALAALRAVIGPAASQRARGLAALPLRVLAVVILVTAAVAVVLAVAVGGGPRWFGLAVAALGAVAAVLLELLRRRIVDPARRSGSPFAVVLTGLLALMLAIGFDLVGVLLLVFGGS